MNPPISASYSLVSPQSLLELVLSGYDLGSLAACRLWYPGVNDTFLAETAAGERTILCVYRTPWRSPEEIGFELDALNHLHRQGVAVARPLPRADGTLAYPLPAPEGTRYAVLFTFAEGRKPDYGQAVARIHKASEGFTSQHTRPALDLDFFFRKSIFSSENFPEPTPWRLGLPGTDLHALLQ